MPKTGIVLGVSVDNFVPAAGLACAAQFPANTDNPLAHISKVTFGAPSAQLERPDAGKRSSTAFGYCPASAHR